MNGLIADYGQINPIAWRVDLPLSDYVRDAYPHYYYPMAHLAVEYLLDPDGLGRSPHDLVAVMRDMGNDATFAEAFEDHIGISESDYESQFFARMGAYLPQSEFPFEAAALGLAALLAVSVMAGSVVWGLRRWPAGALVSPQSGMSEWTRRARIGFVAEVTVFATAAVGVVVLALFSIGFDDFPAGANRALAYTTTAGYFVGSVAILMWAIRRWADQARGAYLIPLLVIVATLILIELINRTLL